MANFKTHVNVGIFLGLTLNFVTWVYGITKNLYISLLAFVLTVIGSFLPDIDSNTGKPIKFIFNFFSITLFALSFYYLCNFTQIKFYKSMLIAIGFFIFVKFITTKIFLKITSHRGMWHSIPVAIIFCLITFIITNFFKLKPIHQTICSLAIFAGYISHLVLDEIYSVKFFCKIPIETKKSFGTAFKLFSKCKIANFFVYILLIVLSFYVYSIAKNMQFFQQIYF